MGSGRRGGDSRTIPAPPRSAVRGFSSFSPLSQQEEGARFPMGTGGEDTSRKLKVTIRGKNTMRGRKKQKNPERGGVRERTGTSPGMGREKNLSQMDPSLPNLSPVPSTLLSGTFRRFFPPLLPRASPLLPELLPPLQISACLLLTSSTKSIVWRCPHPQRPEPPVSPPCFLRRIMAAFCRVIKLPRGWETDIDSWHLSVKMKAGLGRGGCTLHGKGQQLFPH